MQDIKIAVSSFHKLLDYLESLGFDAEHVAALAEINASQLYAMSGDEQLSARLYAKLYRQAVCQMQKVHPHIPWAAGLGTDAFEMLCYSIMGCATLGEALERAERFETLLRPLSGRCFHLSVEGDDVHFDYHLDIDNVASLFAPPQWVRSDTYHTVAVASGLVVWHAFCGWLVGHALEASSMSVSLPSIGDAYRDSLAEATGCQVVFDAPYNRLTFPRECLDYRVVQNQASLQQFLDMAVYQLSLVERQPGTISEAIRQLIGNDVKDGMPSFTDIAERLHLSESSLRRKLLKEQTSFQMIKDQVRCDLAMSMLEDKSLKINDVADQLGFTEPSSFVRSFRNWTGVTPKCYREQHANHEFSLAISH
jgi:AraC-like DNA-binding protein